MNPWLLISVLALGSIGTMTAATIVNVALPSVIGALGLGQDEAQWLSTAFLAASTGFMLLNTWAVTRFGMRASFVAAMTAFIMGSVCGASAQDLWLLIAGRMLQGAGAGLIQPMAMLVIYQRFPEGLRGLAIGIYSLGVIVSPAFGPVLGGWLIDASDWRVVFVATTPLAAVAVPLGMWLLPARDGAAQRPKLDWPGLTLLMMALGLVLQGLALGGREGWDDAGVQARLWGAFTLSACFLGWEARHTHPILNLKLFARPAFCAAGVVIFLTGAAVYGSTWLAPLFVQIVQRYSPAGAGEMLLPAGIAMAICFPIAGRLSDRIDARVLLTVGALIFGGSMLMMSDVSAQTEAGVIAAALALGRTGIGVTMPAANASAMRHAGGMLASAAPAVTFLTQTGGALGVAGLSALLQNRSAFHADALQPLVNTNTSEVMETLVELGEELTNAGLAPVEASVGALNQLAASIWSTAQLLAFRDCFLTTGLACLILVPISLFISPGRGDRSNFTDRLRAALTLFR
jgi:MFS transporter, DHA2 family, multidrug resistance protein